MAASVAAAVALLAITALQNVVVDGTQPGLSVDNTSAPVSYTVPEPPERPAYYSAGNGSQVGMTLDLGAEHAIQPRADALARLRQWAKGRLRIATEQVGGSTTAR